MGRRQRITRDEAARREEAGDGPGREPHLLLDLQRAAGNRAATGFLARRTEPGEGYSGGYNPGPAPERDVADPKSGRSMRRLKVVGLPGYTNWAIVLIPSAPPKGGQPIDILLHLHGFSPGYEGLGHTEGKQPNTDADDIDLYRIGPQMAASGRPMIGILPQGSELSDFNPDDPKKNAKQNAASKGFDADTYIAATFSRLAEMGVWRDGAPTPGRVALSGHSGADMPIAQMVSGEMSPSKLQALFLFDTMYPDAGFEKTIWKAIEQRLDQDLTALTAIDASTTSGRDVAEQRMVQWVVENGFRVYNVHGGFYGKSSQYLVEQRDAWLARNRQVVGTKKSRIHQAILANIRITPGGGGHWNIISADDHLETAIGMLPPGPQGAKGTQGGGGTVARQPAPPQQAPPQQPAPPPTPAQLVEAAAERVRVAVRAAAAPLVGTADGDDVVGILTQQIINRRANTAAQLRRRNPTHPALPLYDVLYGAAVVVDLGVIDARSTRADPSDARRRRLFMDILDGLVTDVQPRTAVEAPATPLDPAVQIPGERALVPRVLPFVERSWEAVRLGVITEFGGLVDGTRVALARANAYFGSLVPAAFRNVTTATSVHPQMNAAFARANTFIDARLNDAKIPQADRTTMANQIRTALGRNTWSANLRENRNAPHRLSDHSFGAAIDIDSSLNPNIADSGALGPVQDVTGDDPTDEVTLARTAAEVESTARELRETSDEYKDAMKDDASLAPVLLRIGNEGRAAATPSALPALTGTAGADLVSAVLTAAKDARATAVRRALWPEGTPAPGTTGAKPPPPPAPPAQILAAERRIQRIGDAYRASWANKAQGTRVGASSVGSKGNVAANGFMNLPPLLVAALAGSDAGNLKWLGTGQEDFMHFELNPRPPLFTAGAIPDPAPPDPVHGPPAS